MDRVIKTINKPTGYKLVRLYTKINEQNLIHEINITGDFFCTPHDTIEKLQINLKGTNITELKTNIEKFTKQNNAQIIGWHIEHTLNEIKKHLKK